MPIRETGGVFTQQVLTGSLSHWVVCGADFSGAINSFGKPVPNSAAEIIFKNISESAYINIMNPNSVNLSFALEEGRSTWDEVSMTRMIQSLGTDVGVDHINASVLTAKRVPYIWGCGENCPTTFLGLEDTPDSYEGFAGYVVAVNPEEDGLIFVPATASNAYSFVASPGQDTLTAVGSDTLNVLPGTNITIVTDASTNSLTINSTGGSGGVTQIVAGTNVTISPVDGTGVVTINSTGGGGGSNNYTTVAPGSSLEAGQKYFITGAGTVTLPPTAGLPEGSAIVVTKAAGNPIPTVFVNVGTPTDIILTDLGATDSLEMDSTEAALFVLSGNTWHLQIGSYNH